ncbi:MAG TPA: ABC transporter ATP-binding protein [Candidatus Dormibacteraeota bacterium]|nr:ABC transporter ATP-binding protein [Candidatus Dormibacteraeota bacterium]
MGLLALRRYLPYLRPYVWLVATFAIAQLGSLAAAASIPKVIQLIIDGPITHGDLGHLIQVTGLLLLIAGVEFAFILVRRHFSGIAAFHMETDLRNDFYAHLQSLQVSFHDNWQSGQLLSRAVADINTVRRFVSFGLIWFLQIFVTFVVVFLLMLELDWQLALVVVLCMVPIAIASKIFQDKYRLIARRLQDLTGDLTTTIEEMATGVRIVKAFGRMPLMQNRFEKEAETIRHTTLSGVKERAELWSEINFLPNLALVAVLLLGGLNVVEGRLSIGGLVAFMSYVFMLTWPMDALGWVLSMSEECQTAVQRLNEVFDSRPQITDKPEARPMEHSRGHLEFRGVGFRYPGSDEWILRNLNLVIEPGETVGLVGRTGSGKTTLAYLAPRLYDVSEGSVLLDGVDVRDIRLRSLRSHIGFAFEEPILFSASVHENLVMGRPVVSDQELKHAIEVAQAQFIWDLPWGLETRVGEQGYTLSGGQRQRLALARAVLGSPPVLILDDPLSSVDVHTEAVIEEALHGVLEGVTGLLVVHRPSTLALADRVALIDGGTIVATGTHAELMHTNALYRALLSQEYEEATA